MSRRAWYAVIGVSLALVWGLVVVAVLGLGLPRIHGG